MDKGVAIVGNGLKCQHARCAGKGVRAGFRCVVDLVMEVRGVDAKQAVELLAARFGFAGFGVTQRGTAELGQAPERGGKPMPMPRRFNLPALFACERSSCVDDTFYATSWAVFTYLKNTHAGQLAMFEQAIAGGRDWRSAWEQAFPGLSVAALDQEMRTWLRSGNYAVQHFKVRFRDYPASQRTLSEADIHAIRGLLAPHAEELVEVAAAKRLEPTHVLANMLSNVHDKALDGETARGCCGRASRGLACLVAARDGAAIRR